MGQKATKIKPANRLFYYKNGNEWCKKNRFCMIYDKDVIVQVYEISGELDIHCNLDYKKYKYVIIEGDYELHNNCHLPDKYLYLNNYCELKIKRMPKSPPAYDEIKKS